MHDSKGDALTIALLMQFRRQTAANEFKQNFIPRCTWMDDQTDVEGKLEGGGDSDGSEGWNIIPYFHIIPNDMQ